MALTTFIIPSVDRPSLIRAVESAKKTGAEALYQIDYDKRGRSWIRNNLIQQATTPWVSFLDDDDTVYCDYVERLQEEVNAHPEAEVIHFREYFMPTGHLFPTWPVVEWGNVGISFSVKRELALQFPFIEQPYEDFKFVENLHLRGYVVYFSKYVTYKGRH